MRWKNIKTVMIVILLAVNVWLIYLLAGRYRAQTYLDIDLLRNTVEILARDEIYLTVDQLDARRRGADVYAAELCDDYFEQVAAIFTSSPVTEVFPTPTGMRFITEREETVSVSGGFDLTYVCAGASREAFSGLCTTIASEGEPVSVGGFSLRSLRDTLDTLLSSTVSGGGSVAPAHAKLCFDAAWQQDGYTLMQCSQEMDEKKSTATRWSAFLMKRASCSISTEPGAFCRWRTIILHSFTIKSIYCLWRKLHWPICVRAARWRGP